MHRKNLVVLLLVGFMLGSLPLLQAQDRLKLMPGNDQYEKMSKLIPTSVKLGSVNVAWKDGGKAFEYAHDGIQYRFDIADQKKTEIGKAKGPVAFPKKGGFKGGGDFKKGDLKGAPIPPRGRQAGGATSPDGKLKAFYRDHNLWISEPKAARVPRDRNRRRVKYAPQLGLWQELNQRTAMGGADSKKIAIASTRARSRCYLVSQSAEQAGR